MDGRIKSGHDGFGNGAITAQRKRPGGCLAPRGQVGPEIGRPSGRDKLAQMAGPDAFGPELGPPGPQPAGQVVQVMFLGEANGTMHLMGDGGSKRGVREPAACRRV